MPLAIFNSHLARLEAALITHIGLVNNGIDSGARNELNKWQHTICQNFPFFHVAGTLSMMSGMYYGGTLVMPALHFNPEESLKAIVEHKCDTIYATPSSKSFNVKDRKSVV